jgi:hypothetical protein
MPCCIYLLLIFCFVIHLKIVGLVRDLLELTVVAHIFLVWQVVIGGLRRM